MPGVKDTIIEIVKWIRESVRPVVVIFVLTAIVLFVPHSWVSSTGLGDGFSKYRFIAFLGFVGSFIWLISFPIEGRYYRWKGAKYLNYLTQEEKDVLSSFILNSKKTQAFSMNLPIARHLALQHVVTETLTNDVHGHTVFVIKDWAYSHLREHPELLGK